MIIIKFSFMYKNIQWYFFLKQFDTINNKYKKKS